MSTPSPRVLSNAQLLQRLANHIGVSRKDALRLALELADSMRQARRLALNSVGWVPRILWQGKSGEQLFQEGYRPVGSRKPPEGVRIAYGPTGAVNGTRIYIGRWVKQEDLCNSK